MEPLTSAIKHTETDSAYIWMDPLCDMNVFVDMNLLMFMQTHTHTHECTVLKCVCMRAAGREVGVKLVPRLL